MALLDVYRGMSKENGEGSTGEEEEADVESEQTSEVEITLADRGKLVAVRAVGAEDESVEVLAEVAREAMADAEARVGQQNQKYQERCFQ